MKRSERYSRIPWAVLIDGNLSADAKLVYAILAAHAFHGNVASVGQRRIGEFLGLSLATVSRKVSELQAAGYIEINSSGPGSRAVYVLTSKVFNQKQRSGVTTVVSSPSGGRRFGSVGEEVG